MARRLEAATANPRAGARLADHAARLAAARIVSAYVPIRSEIDPMPLAGAMMVRGAMLALPVVEGRRMSFRLFDPAVDLVAGPFGLMQPPATAPTVVPDLVLTPLLAFDRDGFRLGYGAGHYDRWLGDHPDAVAAGVAFAAQELPTVPREAHDVPLHYVVTELELIEGRRRCA